MLIHTVLIKDPIRLGDVLETSLHMPLTATPAEMVPVQCRNAESQTWGINLDKT